jgi:hypothetical protein
MWSPPNKLCARYLAPYLSSQTGDGADVMCQDADGVAGESALDHVTELAAHPSRSTKRPLERNPS